MGGKKPEKKDPAEKAAEAAAKAQKYMVRPWVARALLRRGSGIVSCSVRQTSAAPPLARSRRARRTT